MSLLLIVWTVIVATLATLVQFRNDKLAAVSIIALWACVPVYLCALLLSGRFRAHDKPAHLPGTTPRTRLRRVVAVVYAVVLVAFFGMAPQLVNKVPNVTWPWLVAIYLIGDAWWWSWNRCRDLSTSHQERLEAQD
jgi:hypothetical protein